MSSFTDGVVESRASGKQAKSEHFDFWGDVQMPIQEQSNYRLLVYSDNTLLKFTSFWALEALT